MSVRLVMATVWLGAVVSRMRDVNDRPYNDRPYTVEFILPSWSVEHDIDFRRWLLGFGSRIVIEAPELFPTPRSWPVRSRRMNWSASSR